MSSNPADKWGHWIPDQRPAPSILGCGNKEIALRSKQLHVRVQCAAVKGAESSRFYFLREAQGGTVCPRSWKELRLELGVDVSV